MPPETPEVIPCLPFTIWVGNLPQCLASLLFCEDGQVIFRGSWWPRATFRVGRGRETMRAVKLEKRDGRWLIVETNYK